jgi:hypothetical protein
VVGIPPRFHIARDPYIQISKFRRRLGRVQAIQTDSRRAPKVENGTIRCRAHGPATRGNRRVHSWRRRQRNAPHLKVHTVYEGIRRSLEDSKEANEVALAGGLGADTGDTWETRELSEDDEDDEDGENW